MKIEIEEEVLKQMLLNEGVLACNGMLQHYMENYGENQTTAVLQLMVNAVERGMNQQDRDDIDLAKQIKFAELRLEAERAGK